MLDLGFLEDVERILGLCPNGRQTALFSATMPNEIRALAERHLYDPITVKVKAATLTIDTVEQFYLETKTADKVEALVARARGREAQAGDRLRAHEDPLRPALPHAARQGLERQGAARRHEPGLARRRDDLVQGRARADHGRHRRRRRAGWTSRPSRTSSTSTSRRRRTSTCTASAAPAGSAARAARSRSSTPSRRATSMRSRSTPTRRSHRGSRARTSPPSRSTPKPRRHRAKPRDADRPRSQPTATSRR